MAALKRFNIILILELPECEADCDDEMVVKVVTDKTFSEVVDFAERMVGTEGTNGQKIVKLESVRRYSDVEVI